MITTDDRRAREALIAAYAAFDRGGYCVGGYQRYFPRDRVVRRCMIGEVAHQLGLHVNSLEVYPRTQLYWEIHGWFAREVGVRRPGFFFRRGWGTPEGWSDVVGRERVMAFLADRIADLDRELHADAPPPPEPEPTPTPAPGPPVEPRPLRALAAALAAIFTA